MKQIKKSFISNIVREIPNCVMNGTMCLKPYFTDKDIIRETAKAVYIPVTFENIYKNEEFTADTWIPKSCIEEIPDEMMEFQTHVRMLNGIIDDVYPYGLQNSGRAARLLLKILGENYTDVSHNAYINIDVSYAGELPESIVGYNTKKSQELTAIWTRLREMFNALKNSKTWGDSSNINNADYVDRFDIANSIDNIMASAQTMNNDEKMEKFERGSVYIRAGYVFYDAHVVIGTTNTGRKVLVEVMNVQ